MSKRPNQEYFFSIEPFWPASGIGPGNIATPSGEVSVGAFHWGEDNVIHCVPGNGQVAIMLRGPEDFRGYCYGLLEEQKSLPLHGLKDGEFVRFAPGTFSRIFGIPANLISPSGAPLENIFTAGQLAQIKDAVAAQDPRQALLALFGRWEEDTGVRPGSQETQIARQVAALIWEKRGQIRVKEMESETSYSGRYLQDVVGRNVGITPKQLCRQTRFQNALLLLGINPEVNLSWAAQTLGYSDQAHFCREFKQFSGMSPQQYQQFLRERNRAGTEE